MAFRLRPDVSTVGTDGAQILLDQRSGRYFQLNETGALILRDLLDGLDTDTVARRLADRYPVDTEQAAVDIRTLTERLRVAGLTVG